MPFWGLWKRSLLFDVSSSSGEVLVLSLGNLGAEVGGKAICCDRMSRMMSSPSQRQTG